VGQLQARAQLRGRPRPHNDTWIAACCLLDDLPLATLNLKDFAEYEGADHHLSRADHQLAGTLALQQSREVGTLRAAALASLRAVSTRPWRAGGQENPRSGSRFARGASSMAEQRTFNPLVQGSSPWRPTSPNCLITFTPATT
jgi:hypothetical protein